MGYLLQRVLMFLFLRNTEVKNGKVKQREERIALLDMGQYMSISDNLLEIFQSSCPHLGESI